MTARSRKTGSRRVCTSNGSDALCRDGSWLLSLTTTPVPEMHYKTERASFSRIIGHGAQFGSRMQLLYGGRASP